MGDHVLVKWASEDKWDVYPVRNIKSQTVVCQLIDDPKCVSTLTNQAVQFLWKDDEITDGYGAQKNQACDGPSGSKLFCKTEVLKALQEQGANEDYYWKNTNNKGRGTRNKLQQDIKKTASNLRKATSQLTDSLSSAASPAIVPAAQVDIGDGVLIDEKLLERITLSTQTQPSKFARALLRAVFTVEELENSSLKGKVCPANKDAPPKKALDKRRLDAVVSYTCSLYKVSIKEIRTSLASMLARRQVGS
ncbi:uncharacterized protein LOC119180693 [Rhipicephalus microplus]|uniref:uncharacterized protein LOC119180693 n=1 Tax=Rhipicephalus microplus TaxID=6941 RepID=UPI003F6B8A8E